ncbi:hypothetical protein SAMN05660199_04490 [Klenkia soli]|uniref:Uncharacterized protein n=1 Tax=Klenkia soli TaxID=1052260 RepID=A0A1H0UF56_9ACTN|nr:hypothetical protein [Klenkia soli]SDP64675.1 hypothetical protein SAMN05660199_04490 [Klenkia soli]
MSDADHSVRSLAEILREHGLESDAGTRPGTTGPVRQKRKRTVEETVADKAERAGTTGTQGRTATGPPDTDRRTGDRRTGDRRAATPPPPLEARATPVARVAPGTGSRFGRRRAPEPAPATVEQPVAGEPGPTTAAIPGMRTGRTPGFPAGVGSRADAPAVPSTGPIPKVVLPADDEDAEPLTAAQSAVAWARFVGELLLALAVGVGVYYLFTVLWELVPYAAVVAAPLAIAGMVGGVTFWRGRHGQGPLETRLLVLLLFAGTLLVVVPAAGLLSGS